MPRPVPTLVLALSLAAGGAAATPAAASASCTEEYYVCLNNEVYTESGLRAELEAIECGIAFIGCLSRKL